MLDKTAAQNHNIIRNWCLSILKPLELMNSKLSMKKNGLWSVCRLSNLGNECYQIKTEHLLLRVRIIHAFGMFGVEVLLFFSFCGILNLDMWRKGKQNLATSRIRYLGMLLFDVTDEMIHRTTRTGKAGTRSVWRRRIWDRSFLRLQNIWT